MGMQTPSIMGDTYGVPTFYVDTAIPEDAGNGNIRVWNCHFRNGILIPQCEVIIHATKLYVAGRRVGDFAEKVFNDEQMKMDLARH